MCDLVADIVTPIIQANQAIPPKGTENYYQAVRNTLPNVETFYRHYEVPGLGHCFGGRSGSPTTLFKQLGAWVENGTATGSVSIEVKELEDEVQKRVLCPYPQKAEPKTMELVRSRRPTVGRVLTFHGPPWEPGYL